MSNQNENEVDLLDYVAILVKHRWMILRNFGVVFVLSIILAFIWPKTYTAETTLMPPQEVDEFSMMNFMPDISLPGLSLPNSSSPSEIMLTILESKSVGQKVLSRHFACDGENIPLYECLNFESIEKGLKGMKGIVEFFLSEQGFITISVSLGDRNLAAEISNAYAEELDKVNQEKSISRAKNSRIYIESQLKVTVEKLGEASQKLSLFQQEYKAVSLQEQMKVSIQQAAELKGHIISKEMQVGVMLQSMTLENPLVVRVKQELVELERRYSEFQYGDLSTNGEFYLPFAEVPEVGLKLAELTRNVKVQETVWELLNQQYYQAKIQEARDTPTVQTLDVAEPPQYHSSPKRILMIFVLTTLSVLFSIFWAFGKNYFDRMLERPHEKEIIANIIIEFRKDIGLIKSKIMRKT